MDVAINVSNALLNERPNLAAFASLDQVACAFTPKTIIGCLISKGCSCPDQDSRRQMQHGLGISHEIAYLRWIE